MRKQSWPRILLIMAIGLILLAGCGSAASQTLPNVEEPAETTRISTDTLETASESLSAAELAQKPAISTTDEPTAVPEIYVSEEVAAALLDPRGPTSDAIKTLLQIGDRRFVSVLLELMRARQIGLIGGSYNNIVDALEELSGQDFGDDWPAWIEWYGKSDLVPPPGFTGWKGQLLSGIDPEFANFLREDLPARIRTEEILWGGVRVDGIPPLENPPVIAGEETDYLLDEEPVFGIVVNGEARAYPLRIVDNHEMVNDVIGGVPVSIAYCTLCGAAIAYDGRSPDGQTITFGTSGFLYRSNKLMYDRPTRTLWNQLTGRPVLGELADQDIQLNIMPIVLSAWSDWLARHPDTQVLDRDTGVYPAEFYEPGVLYGDYFASDETMFPVWQRSNLLEAKSFVYALHLDGVAMAYEVEALAAEGVVNDTIGRTPVVLVTGDILTVNGRDNQIGPVSYSNGGEVRVYQRGEATFSTGAETGLLVDGNGGIWQVTEEALLGPEGQELPRVAGHLAYWFGWYAFFPNTGLYTGPE